jgi:phage-related protein
MAKTYKKRISSLVKSTNKKVKKVLPVVNDSIKTAAVVAKDVAEETIPIVEKGVSNVYGAMSTGFNLGVSSAKKVGKSMKNISKRKLTRGGSRRRKIRFSKRKH